jgi:hypothetical protein
MNANCQAAQDEAALCARLIAIVSESECLMSALRAVRALGLADWCIGAGAVRNAVWDHLHHYATPSAVTDVDVAYFDASGVSGARDAQLALQLSAAMPEVPWEVTNQALVHTWYESYFGHAVAPLESLNDALASWPEFATCVGVWLKADDTMGVIAPHGLQDLFSLTVRHNPSRVSAATYEQRLVQKQYAKRWPLLTVLPSVP